MQEAVADGDVVLSIHSKLWSQNIRNSRIYERKGVRGGEMSGERERERRGEMDYEHV